MLHIVRRIKMTPYSNGLPEEARQLLAAWGISIPKDFPHEMEVPPLLIVDYSETEGDIRIYKSGEPEELFFTETRHLLKFTADPKGKVREFYFESGCWLYTLELV